MPGEARPFGAEGLGRVASVSRGVCTEVMWGMLMIFGICMLYIFLIYIYVYTHLFCMYSLYIYNNNNNLYVCTTQQP